MGEGGRTCGWPWGTRERGVYFFCLLSLPLTFRLLFELSPFFLPLSAAALLISTHLSPTSPHLLCISQHLVHCLSLSLAVLSWQATGQSPLPSKDDFVSLRPRQGWGLWPVTDSADGRSRMVAWMSRYRYAIPSHITLNWEQCRERRKGWIGE